ncbi:MAG: hypothetical protein WAN87_02490 [Thermoplasmata archaeon]
MVDVQELPATPPEDHGGDERIGLEVAGGLLIFLGWGLGFLANLLLHAFAPRSGWVLLGIVRIFPTLGPYAWAIFGLGLVTGAIGFVFLFLSRQTAKGPFVLPGFNY